MRVPHCLLCYKRLVNRERGEHEGGGVVFADHIPLEELESDGPIYGAAPGFEFFCDEHLPAAQALSHLTSKEALIQLEQQFGKFEEPKPEPDPPPTRWQRFCNWFRDPL